LVNIDKISERAYDIMDSLRNGFDLDHEKAEILKEEIFQLCEEFKREGSVPFEVFSVIIDTLYGFTLFKDVDAVEDLLIELFEGCM